MQGLYQSAPRGRASRRGSPETSGHRAARFCLAALDVMRRARRARQAEPAARVETIRAILRRDAGTTERHTSSVEFRVPGLVVSYRVTKKAASRIALLRRGLRDADVIPPADSETGD